MICRRIIITEALRPNLDRQPSEREVLGTPWSSVGHAGMFFQDTETEPELLEPALFARNRSGAEAAGTFCSEPDAELSITISYAVDTISTISSVHRRSAAAPATKTNRAPNCTVKLSQRVQGDVGIRFMRVTEFKVT